MIDFDPLEYRQQMQCCHEMIQATHDWEGEEGFIADGVICPEVYATQPLRILCVLAESWGYEHCGMTNIERQPADDIFGLANRKAQTPRKLAALLWLLQQSLERGTAITRDEFPRLFTINQANTAALQNTLSKVAWLNIKKASHADGTAMIDAEVAEHAARNGPILRKQIEAIKPDLIIIGGNITFISMHRLKLLPDGVEMGRKWQVQQPADGPTILEVTHPRSWWGYKKLYNHFLQVYETLAKPALAPII